MNPQVVVTPQVTYLFATHDLATRESSNLIFTLFCDPEEGRTSCQFNKIDYTYVYARSHYTAYPLRSQNHFNVDEYLEQHDFLNKAELLDWSEAIVKIQEKRILAVFGNTLLSMPIDPNPATSQPMTDKYFPMAVTNLNYAYKSGPDELTYIHGKDTYTLMLSGENLNLEPGEPMPMLHNYGASVLMQEGTELWVIGGYDQDHTLTNFTHFIKDGTWYEGPRIGDRLKSMCAVNMFDEIIFIIGGENDRLEINGRVTAYKILEPEAEDYASKMAGLLTYRRNAACTHYYNPDLGPDTFQIIVAGGEDIYGMPTAQVELFVYADMKWKTIEPMPYVNSHGAWMQISDETLRYFPGFDLSDGGDLLQPLDFSIADSQRWLSPVDRDNYTTTTPAAKEITTYR